MQEKGRVILEKYLIRRYEKAAFCFAKSKLGLREAL